MTTHNNMLARPNSRAWVLKQIIYVTTQKLTGDDIDSVSDLDKWFLSVKHIHCQCMFLQHVTCNQEEYREYSPCM